MITLILAISWTIALICSIILASVPENIRIKPTWLQVILPIFVLVLHYWVEVFA